MPLLRKSLRSPDEVRTFPNGRIEVFNVGDTVVGRVVYEPGWRWSNDVKPLVMTDLCDIHHKGFVISGRLRIAMADGPEMEVGPGDLFEIPPGHDAWVAGDEPWVSVDYAGRRYFAISSPTSGQRTLATVLFTDIVDSTPLASRLGDAGWKELIAEHNQQAEVEIERTRGRLVSTTGDGLLIVHESPAAALACAVSLIAAADRLGFAIRAGVHSGEVEIAGSDVRGIAVNTAARVMAAAGARQVVASRTTRDLAAGSEFRFESRGMHELKGLDEPVELFAVVRPG